MFNFNMTKKDYIKAFEAYSKKHQKALNGFCGFFLVFTCVCIFFVLLMLVLLMMRPLPTEPPAEIYLLAGYALLLLIPAVLINPKLRIRRWLKRQMKNGALPKEYFGPQTLEVKEDRILIHYGESKAERFYAGIEKIEGYTDSTLIFVSAASFDIIPSSAFKNTEERLNFINLMKARMATAKDVPAGNENLAEERAAALMNFDFSWDEQRYINALVAGNRVISKTKLFWRPGRIAYLFLGILSTAAALSRTGDNAIWRVVMLCSGGILLFSVLCIYTPYLGRAVKKQVQSGGVARDAIGNHTVCVFESKLKLFSRLSSQDLSFDQLYGIKQIDGFIILLGKASIIFAIPTLVFKTPESLDGFMKLLSGKIKVL